MEKITLVTIVILHPMITMVSKIKVMEILLLDMETMVKLVLIMIVILLILPLPLPLIIKVEVMEIPQLDMEIMVKLVLVMIVIHHLLHTIIVHGNPYISHLLYPSAIMINRIIIPTINAEYML
jgi:hypothetical protein